ncbi:glycosyltransferase family 2 protein [Uliginosibacterium sp. H3]|uniref:Glycosyltransferase family 2 protein n=1 Tax=Uliginosibacterium silvisoli TaxID=3114758 RepID=A0ABU6K2B0_9RHOO|nr:glycosyltransferase family 2 protein [Uliginosibacterium sp. H3]
MTTLSVGLVTYHPDRAMLRETLASLLAAAGRAKASDDLSDVTLQLVDNGNDEGLIELARQEGWKRAHLLSGQGNVGFGQGHNLVMEQGMGDLHLILNPDVSLQPDSLSRALQFMQAHPECVLLSPAMQSDGADWHFLCKRPPAVFDLFLRGFAPRWMRSMFKARMARYEMEDQGRPGVMWDPPIVSGCFMLCRAEALRQLKGFDPRYFLYFEDFDLSLRAKSFGRLAAVSDVRITHFGGGAARKGWIHVKMFCQSAWVYFGLHGWKWM